MKKVSLLILLVLVLSTVLMAAVPTKMVRLTIINKSDYDVFMKLTGSAVTEAFYYLTVPTGSTDAPTIKVFTVLSDVYDRETWQCGGIRSAGNLVVTGNIRLTFTPCGRMDNCRYSSVRLELWDCAVRYKGVYREWINAGLATEDPAIVAACGDTLTKKGFTRGSCVDLYRNTFGTAVVFTAHRQAGEPTMEKVTYFRYLQYGVPSWSIADLYNGYFNFGCATWYWRSRVYRTPVGCAWRYQY